MAADGGGDDVDAGLAERGADAADHPRLVAVAEDRQVRLELDVEARAPGLEQVRAVAVAEHRADDARAVAAADDRHADEVGEVARRLAAWSTDRDPALLGERRRVDVVDLLLGVAGEHALEHLDREQAGVALGEAAEDLDLDRRRPTCLR